MTAEPTIVCASCGAEVTSEVPEYYIELECFRMIRERGEDVPRRGSDAYHEAIENLSPEIKKKYFENSEMYNEGHRWCPKCGIRLGENKGFGLI
jgi:hypothetical protein